MLESPGEIVFLIGFVVYVVTRGVFEQRTKSLVTVESRLDRTEVALLAGVMIGSLLLPVLGLFTPLFDFADYRGAAWMLGCGSFAIVLALWLFWRAHVDLGLNWSAKLEIRSEHELVTRGVYRRIRHPMYLAIFLFSLAQALLLRNWIVGPAAFVTFLPLYLHRVGREEQMMIDRFGESYRSYQEKSGSLWPRLAKRVTR